MKGTLSIAGDVYAVVKAELHLPVLDYRRYMYLSVWGERGNEGAGFDLWNVELALLESFDELDGKRIHVRPDGESYEDDTLGCDIIGMDDERSFWQTTGRQVYAYGDIRIHFQRLDGDQYRCHVDCTLAEVGPNEERRTREFPITGSADFAVTADEIDPDADLR
jgi:hypothetical protein